VNSHIIEYYLGYLEKLFFDILILKEVMIFLKIGVNLGTPHPS